MPFMSFLGIALRDSFHYKSRLVGSILGALIAVSFIAGAVISVDSISSKFMENQLEDREYHLSISRMGYYDDREQDIDVDLYAHKIASVKGVDKVYAYVYPNINVINATHSASVDIIAVNNDTTELMFGERTALPNGPGEVIISSALANRMFLKVGDRFNMSLYYYSYKEYPGRPIDDPWGNVLNITFKVFAILDTYQEKNERYYYDYYGGNYQVIMGIDGLRSLISSIDPQHGGGYNYYLNQYMHVKISSSYLDNLDDAKQTRSDVKKLTLKIGIELKGSSYEITSNDIESIYAEYTIWALLMRIFFVVLSVPLLLISFYLLSAGSKVGMEERIREIGLLKIKGASRGQVVSILLMESLIYGLAGGALGLFLGSILSSFFTAQVYGLKPFEEILHGNLPLPGIPLLIIAFVIVPIIILIMRLTATFRLSRISLLEALGRATIADKQKKYKITLDLMILSFTMLIIGLMLYFNANSPTNFYMAIIYMFLLFLSPLTILFLPFFLILSISRILILGFDFTLDILSNIGRLFIDELYPVVRANMHFQRKRIATLTILVTAVISFGILISSLDASRSEKVEKDVAASIPTDLLVVEGGMTDHGPNITSADGVEWVVEVETYTDLSVQTADGGYISTRIIAFDSAEFDERVDVPDRVRSEGKGLSSLNVPGTFPILINDRLAYDMGLSVGDTIEIQDSSKIEYDNGDGQTNVRYHRYSIEGIVSYIPGTRSTIDGSALYERDPYLNLEDMYEMEAIYMDRSNVPENSTPSFKTYLIDSEGRETSTIDSIERSGWNNTPHLTISRAEQVKRIKEEPFFTSIQMLLDMEYLFVIAAVTGGVMLFMTVSTASRRREFAELIARGSTRVHVLRLVLTEGTVVLTAGLIIGTFIGMITAYAFQHLFTLDLFQIISMLMESGNGAQVDTGSGIVFPPKMLLLHLFASVAVLGASLLTSYLASKVDVASSLRLRTS